MKANTVEVDGVLTERRLAAIVESSEDAIVSKDLNGIVTSWNSGANRLFGYEAEEIIGKSITLLIPPERLCEEEGILARIRRGERIEHYETIRRRKDGKLIDISLTVSPIRDEKNRIVGASKIARDITERKRASESLAAHARRAEALSMIAGELLLTESPRALLPSIFKRAAAALSAELYFNYFVSDEGPRLILESCAGLTDSQHTAFSALAIGQALCGTSAQRRAPIIIHHLQKCELGAASDLRGLGVRGYSCHPLQVGERLFGTISFASKSRDSFDLEELRFMATLSDLVASSLDRSRLLREVNEARDSAERANRAKDDFLATLSHELRTPLSPVLLVAGAAAKDPALPESVRTDFATICKNINLETRLIDDLLDLTRITHGKLEMKRVPCDIHTILRDAIANLESEIQQKGISLSLDFQAEEHHGVGDPVRLTQVFWNVLKNAVKFTPEGGEVAIGTRNLFDGSARLSIRVADTGIGMTAEEQSRVFDAFSQGRHAEEGSHRYEGLGLGLSISRMLIELHLGEIRAESAGPGRGSVFVIELPLVSLTRATT
ncbi:MAG: PAS domain S-box protein [Terrimicrobiaceae bacterium]